MRLWSLHPKYLDARGLVALWREALLAQAVLRGRTVGYRQHPQLERLRAQGAPVDSIAEYLRGVHAEAVRRGYVFAEEKIWPAYGHPTITVTRGQIEHEWGHLMGKLALRDREAHDRLRHVKSPQAHPLFRVVPGSVEWWEKGPQPPPFERPLSRRLARGRP